LRPNLKRFKSYNEAAQEIKKFEAKIFQQNQLILKQKELHQGTNNREVMDVLIEEGEVEEDLRKKKKADTPSAKVEPETKKEESLQPEVSPENDQDYVRVKSKNPTITSTEDDDFEKEYNKMMKESLDSRKFVQAKSLDDMPVPLSIVRKANASNTGLVSPITVKKQTTNEEGAIKFALLSKKK